MAEIRAFQAVRHNPAKVNPQDVLTQPYDKITPEMQERYYGAHPDNLIVLEKGRALPGDTPQDNVYTRARRALEDWLGRGILTADAEPGLYAYYQDFSAPGAPARKLRRKSFIAVGRLEDYSAGVVHRHELTLTGPRQDRLELLRHTRAQTGLLFMLYEDPAFRINRLLDQAAKQPPAVEFQDEFGVHHTLWPVADSSVVEKFAAEMRAKKLVIADGHHRYETALAFRDEFRARRASAAGGAAPDPDAAYEFAMMAFVNSADPGLVILPAHRVVANLSGFDLVRFRGQTQTWFEWQAVLSLDARGNLPRALTEQGRNGTAIGVYAGAGRAFALRLRPEADLAALLPGLTASQRKLDVALLHGLLLEKGLGINAEAVAKESHITYERHFDAALEAVDSGRAQLACLLNPVSVETVCRMALAGEVMPQKSTDFYPKMLSGLTIYRIEE